MGILSEIGEKAQIREWACSDECQLAMEGLAMEVRKRKIKADAMMFIIAPLLLMFGVLDSNLVWFVVVALIMQVVPKYKYPYERETDFLGDLFAGLLGSPLARYVIYFLGGLILFSSIMKVFQLLGNTFLIDNPHALFAALAFTPAAIAAWYRLLWGPDMRRMLESLREIENAIKEAEK